MDRSFKYYVSKKGHKKLQVLSFGNEFNYTFIIIIPCYGDKVLNYLGN